MAVYYSASTQAGPTPEASKEVETTLLQSSMVLESNVERSSRLSRERVKAEESGFERDAEQHDAPPGILR